MESGPMRSGPAATPATSVGAWRSMQAWEAGEDFGARVREDPEIRKTLSEAEIDEVFRLERYLAHVDSIFARVFGADVGATALEARRGQASS